MTPAKLRSMTHKTLSYYNNELTRVNATRELVNVTHEFVNDENIKGWRRAIQFTVWALYCRGGKPRKLEYPGGPGGCGGIVRFLASRHIWMDESMHGDCLTLVCLLAKEVHDWMDFSSTILPILDVQEAIKSVDEREGREHDMFAGWFDMKTDWPVVLEAFDSMRGKEEGAGAVEHDARDVKDLMCRLAEAWDTECYLRLCKIWVALHDRKGKTMGWNPVILAVVARQLHQCASSGSPPHFGTDLGKCNIMLDHHRKRGERGRGEEERGEEKRGEELIGEDMLVSEEQARIVLEEERRAPKEKKRGAVKLSGEISAEGENLCISVGKFKAILPRLSPYCLGLAYIYNFGTEEMQLKTNKIVLGLIRFLGGDIRVELGLETEWSIPEDAMDGISSMAGLRKIYSSMRALRTDPLPEHRWNEDDYQFAKTMCMHIFSTAGIISRVAKDLEPSRKGIAEEANMLLAMLHLIVSVFLEMEHDRAMQVDHMAILLQSLTAINKYQNYIRYMVSNGMPIPYIGVVDSANFKLDDIVALCRLYLEDVMQDSPDVCDRLLEMRHIQKDGDGGEGMWTQKLLFVAQFAGIGMAMLCPLQSFSSTIHGNLCYSTFHYQKENLFKSLLTRTDGQNEKFVGELLFNLLIRKIDDIAIGSERRILRDYTLSQYVHHLVRYRVERSDKYYRILGMHDYARLSESSIAEIVRLYTFVEGAEYLIHKGGEKDKEARERLYAHIDAMGRVLAAVRGARDRGSTRAHGFVAARRRMETEGEG